MQFLFYYFIGKVFVSFSASFHVFPLSLDFYSLIMIDQLYLGIYCIYPAWCSLNSCIYSFMSVVNIGNFNILFNDVFSPFFLHLWHANYMYSKPFVIIPFCFCLLIWQFSVVIASSLLILSTAGSNLLMSPSKAIFIYLTLLLFSSISFWLFLSISILFTLAICSCMLLTFCIRILNVLIICLIWLMHFLSDNFKIYGISESNFNAYFMYLDHVFSFLFSMLCNFLFKEDHDMIY